MVPRRSELPGKNHGLSKVQPGIVFVGEADGAVQLDGLTRNEHRVVRSARLRPRDDRLTHSPLGTRIPGLRGALKACTAQCDPRVKIDATMLKSLEAANRTPELLPAL